MSVTQATLLGDTFGSQASGTIPVGGIIMWSGTATPFNSVTNPTGIPVGWALCDGETYNSRVTPDLRERFVVGAGGHNSTVVGGTANDSYAVNDTGGSKDAIVVSHSHGITEPNSGLGHQHTEHSAQPDRGTSSGGGRDGASEYFDRTTAFAVTGITINSEGVSGTNKNLPPYYALAFIMRVS